jgi:hypothetical protein
MAFMMAFMTFPWYWEFHHPNSCSIPFWEKTPSLRFDFPSQRARAYDYCMMCMSLNVFECGWIKFSLVYIYMCVCFHTWMWLNRMRYQRKTRNRTLHCREVVVGQLASGHGRGVVQKRGGGRAHCGPASWSLTVPSYSIHQYLHQNKVLRF